MSVLPTIEILTPASETPVSLDQLKAHLRTNNGTAEDDALADYLATAIDTFEFHTQGRTILTTEFRQWHPCWSSRIELRRAPVQSVEAIHYYDAAGDLQELTGWNLDATGTPALITRPGLWPSLDPERVRPIRIDFTAGWSEPEDVPATIRTAVRLLASHFYWHREAYLERGSLQECPFGFQSVVNQFKTGFGEF